MSTKNYPKVECPECGKPYSTNNLAAHFRAKHPDKVIPEPYNPSLKKVTKVTQGKPSATVVNLCATCSLAYPECGIEKDAKDLTRENVFTKEGDIIVACMNYTKDIVKKQPDSLCDSCLYDRPNCEGEDSQNFNMVNDVITRCDEYRKVEGAAVPPAEETKQEELVKCPFEHLRDYPGCFEDCPDVTVCPHNTPPAEEPPAPQVEEVKRKPPKVTVKVKKGEERLCSLCQEPLKQRPLNRKLDVFICENRACRLYRERQGMVMVKKRQVVKDTAED